MTIIATDALMVTNNVLEMRIYFFKLNGNTAINKLPFSYTDTQRR